MRGKFIVIEGIDGSGKATQTRLLAARLRKQSRKVAVADFPQYGKKSAGPLEEYLNGKYGKIGAYQASLLYAVDRFDARQKLCQWLEEGRVIVSNRYVTTNAGHQGGKIRAAAARRQFYRWLDSLEFGILGLPRADLTLVLHVPAKIAQLLVDKKNVASRAYVNGKKRDLHEADFGHLQAAEHAYLDIARTFPRCVLLECVSDGVMLPPKVIAEMIWKEVKKIL
ncbi:MAG: thymidylate kinase [Patescibacteria group bacterium]|nr:thymidylate kinase [Patescibacteria group bacterium]